MEGVEHKSEPTGEIIVQPLDKLDGMALGIAIGSLFGFGIFVATNFLIVKGGHVLGPNLALLSQFFVGYEITFRGSLIGLVYGVIAGFLIGWLIAVIRNVVFRIHARMQQAK